MESNTQPARPSHCTCGTRLVEDAVFCHRCGRPVFEAPRSRTTEENDQESDSQEISPRVASHAVAAYSASTSVPPPPAYNGPPEPIDLRNRSAVRLAFLTAALQFPLVLLPSPMIMRALLLAAGGFFAAWLYQRRTHSRLGALNGFRLGWISGLMLFLLVLGVYAITFAVISFSGGNLLSQLMEGIQASGNDTLTEQQLVLLREVFSDGTKLFVVLMVTLFLVFLFFTALAGLGGALASRFAGEARLSDEQDSR